MRFSVINLLCITAITILACPLDDLHYWGIFVAYIVQTANALFAD